MKPDAIPKVAIGAKLSSCTAVVTIGLRLNFDDYTKREKWLIGQASRIYFPTIFYAGTFHSAGKSIFPSIASYIHLGDKIRQLALFRYLNIPMPRTRILGGSRQARRRQIVECFSFPFVAKIPEASGRGTGVFFIDSYEALDEYLACSSGLSYIQEYLPIERDLRVVIVGSRAVHSYWKVSSPENFRTNVAQGGTVDFRDIPDEAVELALRAARSGGIDYAGFDLCFYKGEWMVLEANMNFGTEGLEAAGISLKEMLCRMVMDGEI